MYAGSIKNNYMLLDNPGSCNNNLMTEFYDEKKKFRGPFENCYGLGVRTEDAVKCCLASCSGVPGECNESCTDNGWVNSPFQKCVDKICLPTDKVKHIKGNK